MKKLLFFIFLITILSCGVKKEIVIPEKFTVYEPELNTICNSEIGITLVAKEVGKKYKAIKIINEVKVKPQYITRILYDGDIFINYENTDKYELYYFSNKKFGIALPKQGGKPLTFISINDIPSNYILPKNEINYKEIFIPVQEENYFKQEFIYNGRVGNALKFIYREFNRDYIRPAFTQDLQYDLSDSNIIGFRGLRIEVLSATNTKIEYKVLSYFSK